MCGFSVKMRCSRRQFSGRIVSINSDSSGLSLSRLEREKPSRPPPEKFALEAVLTTTPVVTSRMVIRRSKVLLTYHGNRGAVTVVLIGFVVPPSSRIDQVRKDGLPRLVPNQLDWGKWG